MTQSTHLGQRVRFLRNRDDLSMQALADKVDCSKPHIYEIEKGKANPTFDKMEKIAEIFKVSISYFSKKENPMIPTIEQVCEDLIAGNITLKEAIAWLKEHERFED